LLLNSFCSALLGGLLLDSLCISFVLLPNPLVCQVYHRLYDLSACAWENELLPCHAAPPYLYYFCHPFLHHPR
jgi:hypothetical protein